MSYSSTAIRFFTSPKPLSNSMDAFRSPQHKEKIVRTSTGPMAETGNQDAEDRKPGCANAATDHAQKNGLTFANQHKLPKLPVPDLEVSCRKYLESLEALQTEREHAASKAAVEEFLKNDGPALQEKLKNYASSTTSYIEQFWYDSYLNFDNPVVLNLNPFFLLEDDPTPARNNQVTRAASLVVSALSFVRAVRREELPPDTARGTPLCMYQYSRLFGTARIPTNYGCVISQDHNAKHIVVLCRGQFYWFDVLDDNHDLIMTEKDIGLNLQTIMADAEQTPIQDAAKGALGVLSTENRKVWSELRGIMTEDENNAECLEIIDNALFVLGIDDTEPANTSELCANMLCGTSEVVRGVQVGTCTNRWYDKLQIIVCKNGSAGINFEHTGVDGHTVLRFASDVYTDTILRFAKTINFQAPSLWTTASPDPSKRDPSSFGNVSTTPRKLEWDVNPKLSTALRFAESHLADLLQQHEFQVLDFEGYGKNFITSMGFSPDAYVQMALQAAYYGLYGRTENTYEPAMTKIFLHGRTEAVRTVTPECVNFVKTFWADNPAGQKVMALRKAIARHTALTKECSQGQGHDRHLYALYCLWQRKSDEQMSAGTNSNGYSSPNENGSAVNSPKLSAVGSDDGVPYALSSSSAGQRPVRYMYPTPSLFQDFGWDKINDTIISSSNCGNPCLRHFGFGPTSGDGFGIGYIIKDDTISICASSKHRQTARLMQTLDSYLLEMRKLLRATRPKTASPRTSRAREMERLGDRRERRGRVVGGDRTVRSETPTTDSGELDDDGLGGYGFFDAGMLLQALRAQNPDRDRLDKPKPRVVGKKLHLNEY